MKFSTIQLEDFSGSERNIVKDQRVTLSSLLFIPVILFTIMDSILQELWWMPELTQFATSVRTRSHLLSTQHLKIKKFTQFRTLVRCSYFLSFTEADYGRKGKRRTWTPLMQRCEGALRIFILPLGLSYSEWIPYNRPRNSRAFRMHKDKWKRANNLPTGTVNDKGAAGILVCSWTIGQSAEAASRSVPAMPLAYPKPLTKHVTSKL